MRQLICSLFFILAYSQLGYSDNFLEKDLLVQMKNYQDSTQNIEGPTVGFYDYYTCDTCGRTYQSQPSSCGSCGSTSFTRHEQTPGDD